MRGCGRKEGGRRRGVQEAPVRGKYLENTSPRKAFVFAIKGSGKVC